MRAIISLFLIFIFIFNPVNGQGFSLNNKTSSFKVSPGTNLILNSPIHSVKGSLIKEQLGNIHGHNIIFIDGSFQESGNKNNIRGHISFTEDNNIVLDGNKRFQGKRGLVLESIKISGVDNELAGVLITNHNIVLQDENSQVTIALTNKLDSNIVLNGGTIILEEDLFFKGEKRIIGPGRVKLNGHKVVLGYDELIWQEPVIIENSSDFSINSNIILNETWTFSGNSILSGNGNILHLDDSANIVLSSNANLLIRDVILYGISGNKIRCLTDNSTISFQNVKWLQDLDFTFTRGSLRFFDTTEFIGDNKKFVYQTQMTSTINDNSTLILGENFTFSYAPISGNNDLIDFITKNSNLFFDGGKLYIPDFGLTFTSGRLISNKNSSIIIDPLGNFNIGDGVTDFNLNILNGSTLVVESGTVNYKNIDSVNTTKFWGYNSILQINESAKLNLLQDLSVSPGRLHLYNRNSLQRAVGKKLHGDVFYLL